MVRRDYWRDVGQDDIALGVTRIVDGKYFIDLADGMAGEGTLDHELFEVARDMVLTDDEKLILDREIGATESQAEAYRKFAEKGKGATGGITRLFRKLRDFFDMVRTRLFGKNSRDIFREIAGDEEWERVGKGRGDFPSSMVSEAWKRLREDSEKFGLAVDLFLSGKLNPRQPIPVMTTPMALHLAGADVLPVTVNHDTLKKVLEKHKLSPVMLKALPAEMADPVMVFQSNTWRDSLVALLGIRDPKRGSIVVSVALNRIVDSSGKTVNQVTSVYFREKGSGKPQDAWVSAQIEKGNLRYVNTKKVPHRESCRDRNFPTKRICPHGSASRTFLNKEYRPKWILSSFREPTRNITGWKRRRRRFLKSGNRSWRSTGSNG